MKRARGLQIFSGHLHLSDTDPWPHTERNEALSHLLGTFTILETFLRTIRTGRRSQPAINFDLEGVGKDIRLSMECVSLSGNASACRECVRANLGGLAQ